MGDGHSLCADDSSKTEPESYFCILSTKLVLGNYEVLRASLAAHLVKNPPVMQETPVQFLGWAEGICYRLQYYWASLMARLLKNLPAMWETLVRSLGGEDPLEKGMATHSSILARRIPWT